MGGNNCVPEGSTCPLPCNSPTHVQCPDDIWSCDNGTNAGCWMGNHCVPEGTTCPFVCHHAAPVPCADGEVSCDLEVLQRDAGWETTVILQDLNARCLPL